jgi:hypothetical protein
MVDVGAAAVVVVDREPLRRGLTRFLCLPHTLDEVVIEGSGGRVSRTSDESEDAPSSRLPAKALSLKSK